jgi:hypothetical protein|tara:strand:- start:3223 stop:3408 length:186 start_codon:yes stop_codon:yes gene_type:complete
MLRTSFIDAPASQLAGGYWQGFGALAYWTQCEAYLEPRLVLLLPVFASLCEPTPLSYIHNP